MILSRVAKGVVKGAATKLEQRPAEAPQSLPDIVFTLAEAIRFFYSETLGKWHLLDLPRAILFSIMDKSKKTVPMECGVRSDCVQLKDPELLKELYELKKCLTRTMLFSKKSFRVFLFAAGFSKEDVLFRKKRARLLKPAFTVIRDKESNCLFVFIRGTQSIRDTLTDAIGAPVSFSPYIYIDGELKKNMVSGHGHRGMVAAAGWIKKHCTPILLDELRKNKDYQIKVVGHSLGGGTAALLTYMLREVKQFSSCTCVTFGPAASVSSELSEFGKAFIISVINDLDVVPTLSAYSVDGFIREGKVKHENILSKAHSSITAIGSHLPFASSVKALSDHAVSLGSKVVKKHKQRTRSLFSLPQKLVNVGTFSSSKSDNLAEASRSSERSYEEIIMSESTSDEDNSNFSDEGDDNDELDEEEKNLYAFQNIVTSTASQEELLSQLEKLELQKQENIRKEKEVITKDITEEETIEVFHTEERGAVTTTSDDMDIHPLYPPGRIMHIVPENSDPKNYDSDQKYLYLYETPKQLYEKLRVSRRMIFDHMTNKYLQMLQKLINQLEEEHLKKRG
ncbi:hypothetical protein VIGAN_10117200 [Vigna angularis var. angularis]|uniref:Fungal lipase-type domain-containing protein n=2 Tax=Phaseolus angularis TaxID=3914 RepID=A0A0S3T369_PHAAN|nr:uncharacterized protein LOC108334868 [Vigna angularis]BAT99673.1 hypothetical protein VIGAN_10117200 [Vigna angularis var. angularis]